MCCWIVKKEILMVTSKKCEKKACFLVAGRGRGAVERTNILTFYCQVFCISII